MKDALNCYEMILNQNHHFLFDLAEDLSQFVLLFVPKDIPNAIAESSCPGHWNRKQTTLISETRFLAATDSAWFKDE